MDNTLKTFADEVSAYFKKFIITEDSEIQELVYDEKNPIMTNRGHGFSVKLKSNSSIMPIVYIEEIYETYKSENHTIAGISEIINQQLQGFITRANQLARLQESQPIDTENLILVARPMKDEERDCLDNFVHKKIPDIGVIVFMKTKIADFGTDAYFTEISIEDAKEQGLDIDELWKKAEINTIINMNLQVMNISNVPDGLSDIGHSIFIVDSHNLGDYFYYTCPHILNSICEKFNALSLEILPVNAFATILHVKTGKTEDGTIKTFPKLTVKDGSLAENMLKENGLYICEYDPMTETYTSVKNTENE